jgi:2-iminoacetate synthase ThiH
MQEEKIHIDTNNFSYAQWRSKTKLDRLIDAASLTIKTNDTYQPK